MSSLGILSINHTSALHVLATHFANDSVNVLHTHNGDKYLRVKDIHGVVSKVRGQNMKGTDGKRSSRGAH
ncbi:hypothetical protein Tco_1376327 [Tanacetum coccineum]